VKLKKLSIQNFKSLVDLEIVDPNPFSVFVGPNGSGKSNIFEAIELRDSVIKSSWSSLQLFGNYRDLVPYGKLNPSIKRLITTINFDFSAFTSECNIQFNYEDEDVKPSILWGENFLDYDPDTGWQFKEALKKKYKEDYKFEVEQFFENYSRIFVGNESLKKTITNNDVRLNIDASNLEKVLKRILKKDSLRDEIIEWLQLFVPEFKNIEIHTDTISGVDTFLIYEKSTQKPFTKSLISDGTYNILCILTAIYQSQEPQFLCIEEPENGLNPYVVRQLVDFFRKKCQETGHYIWINTHSQTLVRELEPHELILVDKVDGVTRTKQLSSDFNLYDLEMDEAWLSNALGGGVPW
jgi:predicted ATPase